MKRKIFTAIVLAVLFTGIANAQGTGLHDPNIMPTITNKEIIEQSQSHHQNKNSVVLDFEGLGDTESILNYYDGGLSGGGLGPGPDYDIQFSSNALSIITSLAGGSGNFSNNPSGITVLFFLTGQPYMNVPAGFSTGLSFYYSSVNYSGSLQIFDGLDGTGNLLASVTFPLTGTDPNLPNAFNIWAPVSVPFNGVAKSVIFGGVENQIGFDDVTFGSLTPGGNPSIPLSNWALYLGIFLIVMFTAIRFRKMV